MSATDFAFHTNSEVPSRAAVAQMWLETEGLTISRGDGGKLTADRFPPLIAVSDDLERHAGGPHIRRARNYLIFRLHNGRARYALVDRRRGLSLWRLDFTKPTAVEG